MGNKRPFTKINLIWLGLSLAVGYWLLESALHAWVWSHTSFWEALHGAHDPNEIVMRIVVMVLLVGFGFMAERLLKREHQAREHAAHLNRLLNFLSDVNQVISRKRNPQELFDAACRIAVDKGGFHSAWIGLLNEQTGMVAPKAYVDIAEQTINNLAISVNKDCPGCDIISHPIRNRKPHICNDIAASPCESFCRREFMQHGARAAATFPLFQSGEVIGAFTVYATEPDYFEPDEIAVLEEAAGDLSFALDSIEGEKRLRERLEELERFHKATVQREFRIKELRDELERLQVETEDKQGGRTNHEE